MQYGSSSPVLHIIDRRESSNFALRGKIIEFGEVCLGKELLKKK
jgi:hypothetical protein